jgi:hypothetical protein
MNGKLRVKALLAAVAAALGFLSGCSALDVVGRTAVTTYRALLEAVPDGPALDGSTGRFYVQSPGGERFEWSSDFSADGPDFLISLDAAPFLEAGLDPERLPGERYALDPSTRRLALAFEAGDKSFASKGEPSPLEGFRKIVESYRPLVGYHEALDHYGLALGDGNMFEWAKDLSKNDKDMVFVLNPEPLLAAGVDPAKVQGWAFAKVEVKDSAGAMMQVDKFLKPYELR